MFPDKFIDTPMISSRALKTYLVRRQEELSLCRKALSEKDWETLARAGHKMKGNAETFGVPALGDMGRDLENSADEQSATEVAKVLVLLEQRLIEELAKVMKTGPPPV